MNARLVEHGNKRVGPPPVPARMKVAIAFMLDVEDDLEKAAAHAGLAMYLAHRYMRQTHVRRYLLEQRQIRIDEARTGNVRALVAIRDDPANKMASVQAIRTLEAMGGEKEPGQVTQHQSAGITIVFENAPPVRTIDVTPQLEHETSPHAWPSVE